MDHWGINQNSNKKRARSSSNKRVTIVTNSDRSAKAIKTEVTKEKSARCFGGCCGGGSQSTPVAPLPTKAIIKKEKIPIDIFKNTEKDATQEERVNEQLQLTSIKRAKNVHLRRSPLYNEQTFCDKTRDDPCIECTVQEGPDFWENIPKSSSGLRKPLYDDYECMTIERFDTFLNKTIKILQDSNGDDNASTLAIEKSSNKMLTPSNRIAPSVNRFVNEIIGDGVDRFSETMPIMATHHSLKGVSEALIYRNDKQETQDKDDQPYLVDVSSISASQSPDFVKHPAYPGLVFEKQNLVNPSHTSHPSDHSPIQFSAFSSSSSATNASHLSQRSLPRSVQQKELEPYNWDFHIPKGYQWSSTLMPSLSQSKQQDHWINDSIDDSYNPTMMSDGDTSVLHEDDDEILHSSFSLSSVLPFSRQDQFEFDRNTLMTSHLKDLPATSYHSENSGVLSDQINTSEELQPSRTPNMTVSDLNKKQTPKSNFPVPLNCTQLPNGKQSMSTMESSHDVNDLNQYQVQSSASEGLSQQHTSDLSNKRYSASGTDQYRTSANHRPSETSVSDLFRTINRPQNHQSIDLSSVSTAYSVPISVRSSMPTEEGLSGQDKSHPRSSEESRLGIGSTERNSSNAIKTPKEQPSISTLNSRVGNHEFVSLDGKNTRSPTKRSQSSSTNTKIQPSSPTTSSGSSRKIHSSIAMSTNGSGRRRELPVHGLSSAVEQVRSTYDDVMNTWQHFLERVLGFMLPVSYEDETDTDHFDFSSIPLNTTRSWSTITPSTANSDPFDNIGPWWGRRAIQDRSPTIFIFADQPCMDIATTDRQMCTSFAPRRDCCRVSLTTLFRRNDVQVCFPLSSNFVGNRQ